MYGLDPECAKGPASKANSCGIHIHQGTTCTGDALGHYYVGTVSTDPWINVVYNPSNDGVASASVMVTTGGTEQQVRGKAIIIHDYSGARIGCAIIGAPTNVPAPGQALRLDAAGGAGIGAGSGFLVGLLFGIALVIGGLILRKRMMDKKGTPPGKLDAMMDNMIHPKNSGAGGATYTTTTAAAAAPPPTPAKKAPPTPAPKPAPKPEPKKSAVGEEPSIPLATIEKETDARGSVLASPRPPPAKADDAEEELPEGWTAVPDEETGRKYFYNTKTGDTQWKKPTAPAEGKI